MKYIFICVRALACKHMFWVCNIVASYIANKLYVLVAYRCALFGFLACFYQTNSISVCYSTNLGSYMSCKNQIESSGNQMCHDLCDPTNSLFAISL